MEVKISSQIINIIATNITAGKKNFHFLSKRILGWKEKINGTIIVKKSIVHLKKLISISLIQLFWIKR